MKIQWYDEETIWKAGRYTHFEVHNSCWMLSETLCNSLLHRKQDPTYVFSRNETVQTRSQFPQSCICERFIYSHDWSTYFASAK
jgi:hypothetical protein